MAGDLFSRRLFIPCPRGGTGSLGASRGPVSSMCRAPLMHSTAPCCQDENFRLPNTGKLQGAPSCFVTHAHIERARHHGTSGGTSDPYTTLPRPQAHAQCGDGHQGPRSVTKRRPRGTGGVSFPGKMDEIMARIYWKRTVSGGCMGNLTRGVQ